MTMVKPLIAAALALGSAAIAPAAQAQRYYDGYDNGSGRYEQPYRGGYGEPYRGGYAQQSYYRGGYDQRYERDYRGYDQDGRRRCSNGAAGTIIGALAGGLLGNTVAGRGDHALGTILGAGAGALAGRAVDRSGNSGYCR